MGTEIERKFLLSSEAWRAAASASGVALRQGYLSMDPDRTVRIRLAGDEAFITIKGRTEGIARAEFEFSIPPAEAVLLFPLCLPPLIEKTRYEVVAAGHTWEIDEFHGENAGLIVAEIELPTAETDFPRPEWIGREVSHESRYFNSSLSSHPFSRWTEAEQGGRS